MTVSKPCSYNHIIKIWKRPLEVIRSAPMLEVGLILNYRAQGSNMMSSLPSLSKDKQVKFSDLLLTYHMLQPPNHLGGPSPRLAQVKTRRK